MTDIYDIYHDESREESYWHGFLFVPRVNRDYLLSLLRQSRDGLKWYDFLSFKDIKRKKKLSTKAQLVKSWISIALASLQQQKPVSIPTQFFICDRPRKYFFKLDKLIKCKFVVFKERDNHKKMFQGLNKMKKIEITLRMGFKGGIHRLFNEKNPIKIGNFVVDKFSDDLKLSNILKDFAKHIIKYKRNYVSFTDNSKIILQKSDHRKIGLKQNPEDSQFLQLCDILLGGIRFHSYCPEFENKKYDISFPCRALLTRDRSNFFRMIESRFSNGFLLSKCWLENGKWQFKPLELKKEEFSSKLYQSKLPFRNKI